MCRQGRIEVVAGGMFSGKTEELIRRLGRAVIAKKAVGVFKHSLDDRYSEENLGSHAGQTLKARPYKSLKNLEKAVRGHQVIGIDEAQFFDDELVAYCEQWAAIGLRVIVAGLDMDSDGVPFGPMPKLMAVADEVLKLHAVCMVCGGDATHSFHKGGKDGIVEVGVTPYEARCRKHWLEGRKALLSG